MKVWIMVITTLYLAHKWLYWRWVSLGIMYHISCKYGIGAVPDAKTIKHLAGIAAKKDLGIKPSPFDEV